MRNIAERFHTRIIRRCQGAMASISTAMGVEQAARRARVAAIACSASSSRVRKACCSDAGSSFSGVSSNSTKPRSNQKQKSSNNDCSS